MATDESSRDRGALPDDAFIAQSNVDMAENEPEEESLESGGLWKCRKY